MARRRNVLIIGDLHAPFIRKGYLAHCKKVHKDYNCNQVIFIGDIVDNHYSSYHETIPDGLSASGELASARGEIDKFYNAFPSAKVTIGNHDRLPYRKAITAGVSNKWIRGYSEVFGTSGWDFVDHYYQDDVLYVHGDGAGHAAIRARKDQVSVVQGHFHTRCYVDFQVGRKSKVFGVQTGCGVDDSSYAMEYGRNAPRSAIACAVILDNGRLPIVIPMDL